MSKVFMIHTLFAAVLIGIMTVYTSIAEEPSLDGMRSRPFAYADVYRHPAIEGEYDGVSAPDSVPYKIVSCMKNESNCTVFLPDGTWFTTWGQGSFEGHPDQRIVFSKSTNMGKTWTAPKTIVASDPAKEENCAYGIPFVVPSTGRVYLFYFITANTEGRLWAEEGRTDWRQRRYPEHGAGNIYFVFSDDGGDTWSERHKIELPNRDVNTIPGMMHGWVNHPPKTMPGGETIFTFSARRADGTSRRRWQLGCPESNVVRCDNILHESDPDKLSFTLLPKGPIGIRVNIRKHWGNPALNRLLDYFDGTPEDSGWTFQEMTVVALSDGRWVGVGRCYLGSPAYTVSTDNGLTWSPAEPLKYEFDGELIQHPVTMCPIAEAGNGLYALLFTNNDGTKRGAEHIWDGRGTTRNPQWITVAREVHGEHRNGGLVFGEPMVIAEVDDSHNPNLKTGISMPQFFVREGQYFVCYNINKEHILLDRIPEDVMTQLAPDADN